MLVVRNCFLAKPGNASKLAALLKEAAAAARPGGRFRVLTDVTGDFNRVILEYEVDNMEQFDTSLKEYAINEAFRDKMKGYTDLYVSGGREIFKIF